MIVRPIVFTLGLALGAAAQAVAQLATPAPTASPTETPLPSATPLATPSESVTPAASPQPTPLPTETPSPTPVPTLSPTPAPTVSAAPLSPYKYVVEPTPDPNASPGAPQIVRIEINDRVVHVGGQFACRITTTPNVTSLVLTVEGHNIEIPKAQSGLFAGIQTIPSFIPPWFLRTYQVTFNALTPDGQKAATTIPITLAY